MRGFTSNKYSNTNVPESRRTRRTRTRKPDPQHLFHVQSSLKCAQCIVSKIEVQVSLQHQSQKPPSRECLSKNTSVPKKWGQGYAPKRFRGPCIPSTELGVKDPSERMSAPTRRRVIKLKSLRVRHVRRSTGLHRSKALDSAIDQSRLDQSFNAFRAFALEMQW